MTPCGWEPWSPAESIDAMQAPQNTEDFKCEVRRWAKRIGVEPAQIRVQRMSGKWASCSTRRWVSFSSALLNQPRDFQKYVIVHELLHLQVPNHGRLFRSLMSAFLPRWPKILKRFANLRLALKSIPL